MGKIKLEVVTPSGIITSIEVDTVTAPGSEGEFGVLPGHINFLSGIVPGELRFSTGDKTEYMAVDAGFAEVSNDKVSILVDSAEMSSDIDIERAKSSMERAQQRLAQKRDKSDIDFLRAESALKRSISRIKIAEKND